MYQRTLILFLFPLICYGCATPSSPNNSVAAKINTVYIATNTTIQHDVAGFTDSVDVPMSRILADTLDNSITSVLTTKGIVVTGKHVSVGRAYDAEKYYVINTDADRQADIHKLTLKPGAFYTDRLTDAQLIDLHKDVARKTDAPDISTFGFQGDALLVVSIHGRTIGMDKRLAGIATNIVMISAQAVFYTGTQLPPFMRTTVNTHDTYDITLSLFKLADGDLLWRKDSKVNSPDAVLKVVTKTIDKVMPERQIY
jgi:hypothetical protein